MKHKRTPDLAGKAPRKRTGASVRMLSGFFSKSGFAGPKFRSASKTRKVHLPEPPIRVPLTLEEVTRIDEICTEPTVLTEHVRAAIERYCKQIRT